MRGRARAAVKRVAPIGACAVLCVALANCSGSVDPRYGVSASPRVVADGDPVPKGGGVYRVGAPYTVAGQVYVPEDNPHYQATGLASWYGEDFHGRQTANGEVFDVNGISAAHPTLPLPSYARVTNLSNGHSIIVRVNDRGPFVGNRIIDLSYTAAAKLDMLRDGTAMVEVREGMEVAGRAARRCGRTSRRRCPAPSSSRRQPSFPPVRPPRSHAIRASPARRPTTPCRRSRPWRARCHTRLRPADTTASTSSSTAADFIDLTLSASLSRRRSGLARALLRAGSWREY